MEPLDEFTELSRSKNLLFGNSVCWYGEPRSGERVWEEFCVSGVQSKCHGFINKNVWQGWGRRIV